jgi:hypothetical protein
MTTTRPASGATGAVVVGAAVVGGWVGGAVDDGVVDGDVVDDEVVDDEVALVGGNVSAVWSTALDPVSSPAAPHATTTPPDSASATTSGSQRNCTHRG